jgi:hypothetical protein
MRLGPLGPDLIGQALLRHCIPLVIAIAAWRGGQRSS